jgi:hypothetical protein
MSLPYPAQFAEEWWTTFVQLMDALDSNHFAAFEDRNLFFTGGGTWTWDATSGLLEWDDTLRLNTPSTGLPQDLAAASVTLVDGQLMVVDVTRGGAAAVTLAADVATSLSADAAVVALCYRSGDKLYFRNGVTLADAASYSVFDAGAVQARPVDQRDTFTAAPAQTDFELALEPDPNCVPMVFVDRLLQLAGMGEDYQFSGTTVTFFAGLAGGERVVIQYWT